MTEKSGYACPFCGEHSTMVFKTLSLTNCVIRYRKCLTCGKSHETAEIPMEISKVWRNAAALLLEKNNDVACAKLAQNGA